jgi:hypothetical protein
LLLRIVVSEFGSAVEYDSDASSLLRDYLVGRFL